MNNYIRYGNTKIEYDLQYANRKTIGVKIMPDASVHVIAPTELPLDKIKESLLKKASWIIKQKSHFLNFEATEFGYEIKTGYSILYLGRQYKLIVKESNKDEIRYEGNLFLVTVNYKTKAKILFDKWLRQRAVAKIIEISKPIINRFKTKFKAPSEIYFQYMPTRWGSCTMNDKLIFNPNLIHIPKRCIEYVVMHELCHLVHKHHNKNFFDLLTSMMPDWEKRKEKLDTYK
jgi:predicted metal-dependent hydrolase